jgi:hypothetical protein
MVTGWIRTGSELSENHDTRHPNHLIPDLKFHRSAPRFALAGAPFPGPPHREAPSGPERIGGLAPQGMGPFRGIVTTCPRDFAACGTKWRCFDYPAAVQQTQVEKCCFGNPGSMRRNSVLKRKA